MCLFLIYDVDETASMLYNWVGEWELCLFFGAHIYNITYSSSAYTTIYINN